MKKIIFISFSILFLIAKANSQITKGNWLVGGNASFSLIKNGVTKDNYLQLSPNIGYFMLDKFAAGIKLGFSTKKSDVYGSADFTKSTSFDFGPLVRYYFFPIDKQFNILVEGSYQHGIEKLKSNYTTTDYFRNAFSFATGPVVYFNTSVGLEFLIGYTGLKYTTTETYHSNLQFAIGLQVHLEKE